MRKIIKSVISETLYKKRDELGLTQENMAEKICISTRQYADLENGKRLPSIATFINILIVFELDANEIIKKLINRNYKVTDDNYSADSKE